MNEGSAIGRPQGDGPTTPDDTRGVVYSRQQLKRARELLSRLYAARRAMGFYPAEHRASLEAISALAQSIGVYHDEGVDVEIVLHEGEVLLGNQLLAEESVLFDQLVRELTSLGAGSLIVRRGVAKDEIRRLIELLNADPSAVDAAGGVGALAASLQMEHVEVLSVSGVAHHGGDTDEAASDPKTGYGRAVSLLREMERLLRLNQSIPASKVDNVARSLVGNVLEDRYPMLQLAGLKSYDEYTYYHSANVAILSLVLGASISTDQRFLTSLSVSALLHDIGKLSIDTSLLNKPGAPTPKEWEDLCRHPVIGAQLASRLPGIDRNAVVAVLEHHMRYDGSGYPARHPRRQQHLVSRIVAVADSYDAMTSQRSYSAPRTQSEAMRILAEDAGVSYDPALVRLFIRALGVYPPRSVVRLSSGDTAIVVQPSPHDPVLPLVRVIAGDGGHLVEPRDIDLAAGSGLRIEGVVEPRAIGIEVDDYIAVA